MIATKKPRKLHARRSPRYTRPMRAVVYTRFSPRRNASDSVSCEVQEDLCMDLANLRGWPVHSMHRDEGVSGKTMDRPGLEAALAELGPDDVLLVYRRDRLARDLLLAELIRRQVAAAGARIVAVEGDVDGDADDPHLVFVRQVMDAVAELERKMIAARTKASMRAQQRAGKRVGRYAPYGYRIDPDELTATWVADLPSAGDTSFAGAVPTADGEGQLIFNYSSPVDRGWWPWVVGQLRPTHIYSVEVRGLSEVA